MRTILSSVFVNCVFGNCVVICVAAVSLCLVSYWSASAKAQPASATFAPGSITVIPPFIDFESLTSRVNLIEVLAKLPERTPGLEDDIRLDTEVWGQNIRRNNEVWCLQFSFKPVRMIDVDIPNTQGNYDKKKIWYLVYNVKNLGPAEADDEGKITAVNSSLTAMVLPGDEFTLPVQSDETIQGVPRTADLEIRGQSGRFSPIPGNGEPIRFVPDFVLATGRLVVDAKPDEVEQDKWVPETTAVAYNDRIIPLALIAISKRERMETPPETSVSIAEKEIAHGEDYWGVAMWTDVDPRINEFSIFISGLTNAYQWIDRRGEDGVFENAGEIGQGRDIKRRVLKLNWWRVGDADSLNENQLHFGTQDARFPESIFDHRGAMTAEQRKKRDEASEAADRNGDGWVSPSEKALHHLVEQDWLKPAFGYEWLFL